MKWAFFLCASTDVVGKRESPESRKRKNESMQRTSVEKCEDLPGFAAGRITPLHPLVREKHLPIGATS
jgi:hypothetical protein